MPLWTGSQVDFTMWLAQRKANLPGGLLENRMDGWQTTGRETSGRIHGRAHQKEAHSWSNRKIPRYNEADKMDAAWFLKNRCSVWNLAMWPSTPSARLPTLCMTGTFATWMQEQKKSGMVQWPVWRVRVSMSSLMVLWQECKIGVIPQRQYPWHWTWLSSLFGEHIKLEVSMVYNENWNTASKTGFPMLDSRRWTIPLNLSPIAWTLLLLCLAVIWMCNGQTTTRVWGCGVVDSVSGHKLTRARTALSRTLAFMAAIDFAQPSTPWVLASVSTGWSREKGQMNYCSY